MKTQLLILRTAVFFFIYAVCWAFMYTCFKIARLCEKTLYGEIRTDFNFNGKWWEFTKYAIKQEQEKEAFIPAEAAEFEPYRDPRPVNDGMSSACCESGCTGCDDSKRLDEWMRLRQSAEGDFSTRSNIIVHDQEWDESSGRTEIDGSGSDSDRTVQASGMSGASSGTVPT